MTLLNTLTMPLDHARFGTCKNTSEAVYLALSVQLPTFRHFTVDSIASLVKLFLLPGIELDKKAIGSCLWRLCNKFNAIERTTDYSDGQTVYKIVGDVAAATSERRMQNRTANRSKKDSVAQPSSAVLSLRDRLFKVRESLYAAMQEVNALEKILS